MVRILSRRENTIARPNEPDMLPERIKDSANSDLISQDIRTANKASLLLIG